MYPEGGEPSVHIGDGGLGMKVRCTGGGGGGRVGAACAMEKWGRFTDCAAFLSRVDVEWREVRAMALLLVTETSAVRRARESASGFTGAGGSDGGAADRPFLWSMACSCSLSAALFSPFGLAPSLTMTPI